MLLWQSKPKWAQSSRIFTKMYAKTTRNSNTYKIVSLEVFYPIFYMRFSPNITSTTNPTVRASKLCVVDGGVGHCQRRRRRLNDVEAIPILMMLELMTSGGKRGWWTEIVASATRALSERCARRILLTITLRFALVTAASRKCNDARLVEDDGRTWRWHFF